MLRWPATEIKMVYLAVVYVYLYVYVCEYAIAIEDSENNR